MYRNLYFLFDDLRSEFIMNQQEVWTSLTFTLQNDGEFKIDSDYRDLSNMASRAPDILGI
ncbi:immunity protein YezG family protein [Fictibacillus solisalsi]|uniref:immunity protein YezG family protein n=1 Tax=Fictibacillus solisalsi TaxID=459525 RepID=UPI000B7FF3B3